MPAGWCDGALRLVLRLVLLPVERLDAGSGGAWSCRNHRSTVGSGGFSCNGRCSCPVHPPPRAWAWTDGDRFVRLWLGILALGDIRYEEALRDRVGAICRRTSFLRGLSPSCEVFLVARCTPGTVWHCLAWAFSADGVVLPFLALLTPRFSLPSRYFERVLENLSFGTADGCGRTCYECPVGRLASAC